MMKSKVVLVAFPFDDLRSSKVRPALCLTEPIGPYQHVIVAFVTSRVPADQVESDQVILPSDPGFVATGLKTVSVIRLHRLITVPDAMIRRELGSLPPWLQAVVHTKLQKLFALSD